ncbi:MAG TPA: DNA cytosine methyltransferase [Salinimicrobium sp.]|nr:DNA cytosine methyltransferase [Salinimicrobium sp.]
MIISEEIHIFWIDLFCGAGGTTSGIHLAGEMEGIKTRVVACVNHDEKAIASHLANHPDCIHYTEDIRDFEVVKKLKKLVNELRSQYPNCLINIWASLECTNFSKAKGGLPREADSRTLADHLFMYLNALKPDYLWIENVVEFMSWGPLDKSGKPISKKRGLDYLKWIDEVRSYGYGFDWKELNSADFGAYTARKRYFAQFPKKGLPVAWPVKTHTKNPSEEKDLFSNPLKKWKPVKEVLNLENEGNSIFNRKKPLVENTLKRIYAGLVKFVGNGDEQFLSDQHFKNIGSSIENPCRLITTNPQKKLISANFLHSYYGNGNVHSEHEPCPTVTTKDRFAKINYLMLNYSNGDNVRSVITPAATIVNNDKHNLVSVDKKEFIFNPQFKNAGNSIEKPCPTIIARQDKRPLQLIICDKAEGFTIPVYDDDCETMIKIKQFMAYFGIVDIKMRLLEIIELLQIQGFPEDYKLVGNQTDQKKFIGNSVEVKTAKSIVLAHTVAIVEHFKSAA